jgi:hypothetical protein
MRLIVVLLALTFGGAAFAKPIDLPVNDLPWTEHQILVDSDDLFAYALLAASMGLEFDRTYGYREWADATAANEIGIAGQYEPLLLSTGGNLFDAEAATRAANTPLHWEMMYVANHDITMIWAIRNDGERSFVRLLKLAPGRVPDLHLR